MTLSKLISMCISITFITACSSASGIGPKPGFGAVIVDELDNNSSSKKGVLAVTDTGRYLFAASLMTRGGRGTGSFGGETAPKSVRVTWREGENIIGAYKGGGYQGGTIVGDYTIEVASRIPAEVMKYASEGKGRAIRLVFRVKDDGVLLAWSVQESYDGFRVYSYWGGDFPCDPVVGDGAGLLCTPGFYKTPSWYRPK